MKAVDLKIMADFTNGIILNMEKERWNILLPKKTLFKML